MQLQDESQPLLPGSSLVPEAAQKHQKSSRRSSRLSSKASRLSITADNAYEYQESDDELEETHQATAATTIKENLNKEQHEENMTWKSFLILGIFVVILVSQAVAMRSTLHATKVMSQSVPVTVGCCACVTYFTISVLVTAFGGAAEKALSEDERENESGQLFRGADEGEQQSSVEVDAETVCPEAPRSSSPGICRKLCYGIAATFDLRKIWEYFPSAVFFGISQALLVMGPLFVGPGLRNLFGQSKIPLSMLFSFLILGKKHNMKQWIIICCLALAVAMFGMLQKQAKDSEGSSSSAADSDRATTEGTDLKIVFGLIVILLGSAAAVLGGTLQEKMMKKEKKVSIFTQKFQTDISQIFVTVGMVFLLPFLGQGLDLLQESCFQDAPPENMQLRQSGSVYRGVVITVTDGLNEGKEFYEHALRKFETDKESETDFLHDYYEAMLRSSGGGASGSGRGPKFWSGGFLTKEERKDAARKFSSQREWPLPDNAAKLSIRERKQMPHVEGLVELKKKVEKLVTLSAKAPFKKHLRMVAPSEWKRKISIGGNLATSSVEEDVGGGEQEAAQARSSTTTSGLWSAEEVALAKAEKRELSKEDVRGVYHRIDVVDGPDSDHQKPHQFAFCKVDQNLKTRVSSTDEFTAQDADGNDYTYRDMYFRVEACLFRRRRILSSSKNFLPPAWSFYAVTDTAKAAQALKLKGLKNSTDSDAAEGKTFQAHLLSEENSIPAKIVREIFRQHEDSHEQSTTANLGLWKRANAAVGIYENKDRPKDTVGTTNNRLDVFLDKVLDTREETENFLPNPNELLPLRHNFPLTRTSVFPEPDLTSVTAKNHAPEVIDSLASVPLPHQLNGYELKGATNAVSPGETSQHFLLDLHVREGPIAAGVIYSGSYNDPKFNGNNFVCDDIRCNGNLWTGYPYMAGLKDKLFQKDESAVPPFVKETSGATDYESGFFAGWTYMIVLAVGFTMAQYFLNALVNKFVSVIWNKIAHTVATVISFWFGEMLFDNDPESEFSAMQLTQLAMLSVLVFSSIVLFLLSKEEAKQDKLKDKLLGEKVRDNVELAEHKAEADEDKNSCGEVVVGVRVQTPSTATPVLTPIGGSAEEGPIDGGGGAGGAAAAAAAGGGSAGRLSCRRRGEDLV